MLKNYIQTMLAYRGLFRFSLAFVCLCILVSVFYGVELDKISRSSFFVVIFGKAFLLSVVMYLFLFLIFYELKEFYKQKSAYFSKKEIYDRIDHNLTRYFNDRFPYALAIFLSMFGIWFFFIGKFFVGYWGGFYADPILLKIEQWLHFGNVPNFYIPESWYEQNIINFIGELYLLWFGVISFFLYYALLFEQSKENTQQVVWSYMLCWIGLGVGAAIMLSSSGPIFLKDIHPELGDVYQSYYNLFLNSVPEGTTMYVHIQTAESLLGSWKSKDMLSTFSISAMPSLHVIMAWLNFLQAWKINKYFGIVTFIYAMMILFGSVFLLWHYAIDGYVAIIFTTIIWFAVGKFTHKDKNA